MTKRDTGFKPGVSGNQSAKWKPGQSGNPAGKSKRRLEFEDLFYRLRMAIDLAEPAGYTGFRPGNRRQRPCNSYARTIVLHLGQHHATAAAYTCCRELQYIPVQAAFRTRNVDQGLISYFLKQPPEKVQIDKMDSKGQVIRTYTGSAANDNRGGRGGCGGRGGDDSADDESGGGGRFGPPPIVPCKSGINNFPWDLRYPGAKGFEGMVLWGAGRGGPVAVPGAYTIRLVVNGQSLVERLHVEKDPRIGSVTIADLTEQFNLAMQVRDKTTEANEIVILIRELKKQMADRKK